MERIVNYHKKFNDLPEYHKAADFTPDMNYKKPFFKDTLLLEPGDNEMVPYRELHFSIRHKGEDVGIVIRHLLLGRDDVAQGTLFIVVGVMLLVSVCVILIINHLSKKIWRPFYRTLENLINFKFDNPLPEFQRTTIDEFEALNSTLHTLFKRISDDYRRNKEFNENASHELQTHLAIIRANTEKILNAESDTTGDLEEIKKIHIASTRLSQAQKSLLLLSRISNREYSNDVNVDFQKMVDQSLDTFLEACHIRELRIDKQLHPVTLFMDAGLAEILVNNLIKNAVKYNVQNGYIAVTLDATSLVVKNSGAPSMGDPNALLERFAKGENGNLGIGLAIAKQICELYGFSITYAVSNRTDHTLSVCFHSSSAK
jgi:signal transduction histidine kinase